MIKKIEFINPSIINPENQDIRNHKIQSEKVLIYADSASIKNSDLVFKATNREFDFSFLLSKDFRHEVCETNIPDCEGFLHTFTPTPIVNLITARIFNCLKTR